MFYADQTEIVKKRLTFLLGIFTIPSRMFVVLEALNRRSNLKFRLGPENSKKEKTVKGNIMKLDKDLKNKTGGARWSE